MAVNPTTSADGTPDLPLYSRSCGAFLQTTGLCVLLVARERSLLVSLMGQTHLHSRRSSQILSLNGNSGNLRVSISFTAHVTDRAIFSS